MAYIHGVNNCGGSYVCRRVWIASSGFLDFTIAIELAARDAANDQVRPLSRAIVQFIGNGIVANGNYITPRLTDNLRNILSKESLTPVLVDTSEFEKSGGSVFCMKTFIE